MGKKSKAGSSEAKAEDVDSETSRNTKLGTDVCQAALKAPIGTQGNGWRKGLLIALIVLSGALILGRLGRVPASTTEDHTVVESLAGLKQAVRSLETKLSSLAVQGMEKIADFWDSADSEDSVGGGDDDRESTPVVFWKRIALLAALLLALSPFVLVHYVDSVARVLGGDKGGDGRVESFSRRFEYKVDYWMSAYPSVKPLGLLFLTLFLIGVGGLALYSVSEAPFHAEAWNAWSYLADAGNHVEREGFGDRLVSLLISFGGMLIFALMLGLVSDAISEKVDSLKKGRSSVIESNHTLILGWSEKLGSLLKQLALANESQKGGVVVILAEKDKEEMELDIARFESDMRGTIVICRSGSPLVMADLKKVSVGSARSVIVLLDEGVADVSDAKALRIVLSLSGVPGGLRGHVVVEMGDIDNEQLVKLVGSGIGVETVVAHDVIGRLMIQCARQPGLAQVWEDLLGFDGCEFYFKHWPELTGCTFGEVLLRFADAVPCGIRVAAEGGKVNINPPDSYVLQAGDELLVIAEDDDTYEPGPPNKVSAGKVLSRSLPEKLPERILFCGWRRDMDDMIQVLESFLPIGSELWLFSEVPVEDREERLKEGGLDPATLKNVTLVHQKGNPVNRRHLETLPMEDFDSVLILADEDLEDSVTAADSRSLATLLLIRDIQSRRLPKDLARFKADQHKQRRQIAEKALLRARSGSSSSSSIAVPSPIAPLELSADSASSADSAQPLSPLYPESFVKAVEPKKRSSKLSKREEGHSDQDSWIGKIQQASARSIVISEILDSRTKDLVSVAQISDYVLSNELVSMALAMVSEDQQINRVLDELFDEEGNELYIRPSFFYLREDGEELTFYQLMARARQLNEIMFGYKLASADKAMLNPPDKDKPRKWSFKDTFVTISED
ncbi:ion channel DMI1 chloroplast precursor [Klebsormidium nitens]|uniref:Ion channel DMI1 chloroplast n=1 Tax=Klebsormidium nitens TaxID=105231 RepID=A0A1Y1I4P7_KLENI|nr:ion channel DMI1 chloroplast precursor [Klebsormidium nitens]|eukprot:GAQ84141.1 ion channel DMI1 chloroplast precursor [Klebsormidium nitens]